MNLEQLQEFLPFLIPLIIVQFLLLITVLRHILTHNTYKVGNRKLWLVVVIIGMNYVGPILYLVLGKEEE